MVAFASDTLSEVAFELHSELGTELCILDGTGWGKWAYLLVVVSSIQHYEKLIL